MSSGVGQCYQAQTADDEQAEQIADMQREIDRLKKEKELAEAEKSLVTAEKSLLDACTVSDEASVERPVVYRILTATG